MEQKMNNCLHHHSRRWRSDVTNVQVAKKRLQRLRSAEGQAEEKRWKLDHCKVTEL